MPETTHTFNRIAPAIALLLLLLLVVSGPGVRFGLWPVKAGLLLMAIAVVSNALFGLVCLGLWLARRWRRRLLVSGLLSLPAMAMAVLGINSLVNHPIIHNISTDTANPPAFIAAASRRGANSNPLQYSHETAQKQLRAYPDIKTIATPLPPTQAFARARASAAELGWEIYAEDAVEGRIEAVDTTFWFGFKDDIVIRVQAAPTGGGSLVDLRSVSRIGGGDAGTNARRIRHFRDRFLNDLDA